MKTGGLIFQKKTFTNTKEHIDGNSYTDCTFTDCILEYSGGKLPNFVGCNLNNSRFEFSDQAGNALSFLRKMYHGGFKAVVDGTIENIIRKPGDKFDPPPSVRH